MKHITILFVFFNIVTYALSQERESPVDINKKIIESYNKRYESLIDSKVLIKDLISLNGDTLTQKMFEGKVTVIHFFGIGCTGCDKEIPYVVKLKNHYKNKNNVQVIGFTDDHTFNLASYNASKKIGPNAPVDKRPELPAFNYAVYNITRNQMMKYFGINGYPYTFIIDKNGILRFKHYGFPMGKSKQELKYQQFIDEVEQLL